MALSRIFHLHRVNDKGGLPGGKNVRKQNKVCYRRKNEWQLYVLFNSSSVISRRWAGDNERLCATEPSLGLKRSLTQAGLKPGTARSVGQCLTY